MMPWRDQLRLGGKAVWWLLWPSGQPAWANIILLVCAIAVLVGLISENIWGIAGAIAVAVTVDITLRKGASRLRRIR